MKKENQEKMADQRKLIERFTRPFLVHRDRLDLLLVFCCEILINLSVRIHCKIALTHDEFFFSLSVFKFIKINFKL